MSKNRKLLSFPQIFILGKLEQPPVARCQQAVDGAAGLGGVFNWRMDANYMNGVWDWGWNAIRQLHSLLQ